VIDIAEIEAATGVELTDWQRHVAESIYAVPPEEFRQRMAAAFDPLAASARRTATALAAMADAWRALEVALRPYFEAAERRRLRLRRMRTQYRLRRKGRW